MYLCSNSEVNRKSIFQIDVFLFKLRSIPEVDFQYRCIYFETQKYTQSMTFQTYVFIFKL